MGRNPQEKHLKKEFIRIHDEINVDGLTSTQIDAKIDEWNTLVNSEKYFAHLNSMELIIRGEDFKPNNSLNLLKSDVLVDNLSGGKEIKKWHFPFLVLLEGKFEKVYVNGAKFDNGLKIRCDNCDERTNQISSYFEVKNFYFNQVVVRKKFLVIGAKFLEDARFFNCELIECFDERGVCDKGVATFSDTWFLKKSYFDIKLNLSNLGISYSKFIDDVDFFIDSANQELQVENATEVNGSDVYFVFNTFEKSFKFGINSGGAIINKLSLCSSIFLSEVSIFQMESARFDVNELNLDWAIFRDVLVVKPKKMIKAPDFSKANFIDLKKLSLNEAWKIQEPDIKQEDESKFRFLKRYFSEQSDHFKEQQYFSYEMMAREKRLKKEVFSAQNCFKWVKNLSDCSLFLIYKYTSNFGTSWIRPLFWLIVSSRLMALRMDKVPPLSWLDSAKEFLMLGSLEIGENSTVGFWEASTKTLFPILSGKEFVENGDWIGSVYCLANGVLIFLLILGIRNKFKIK